ncbi:MAG: YihY family inner membrane protein [Chitinivibrionales bacterium]|nr:YihY family inner membrane protein [Chitinivibrionales bacterium]
MKKIAKGIAIVFKRSAGEWIHDRAPQAAGAVAFYTIFSLSPLFIVVVGLLGFVLAEDIVRQTLTEQVRSLVGTQGAQVFDDTMMQLADRGGGLIGTIAGIAMVIFGTTTVFAQLQNQLNAIWDVRPQPGKGIIAWLRARVLSFGFVLILGFLLLVSLIVDAALTGFGSMLADKIPNIAPVIQVGNFLTWFVIATLLFAAMFKYLPDVHIQWRDVLPAGLLTSALFSIGRHLIGLYLGHSAIVSAYGAAGSLVIVLLWVFFTSQLFFFGAEFSKAYARHLNHSTPADRFAVPAEEAA